MTDTAHTTRRLSDVPLVTNPTLREVGRHIEDRNDLGVHDSPAMLAVAVFAENYINEYSEDFERERGDVALWSYRGTTEADRLPYDELEYIEVPEHITLDPEETDGSEGGTEDTEGDDTDTDGTQDEDDEDPDEDKMTMTLELSGDD